MKHLDALIATQKKLTITDYFGKNLTKQSEASKESKKLEVYHCSSSCFSKLFMFIGLFKAYTKSIDQLSSLQKKQALFDVAFFSSQTFSVILHCNQCFKTLHLSHKTALSDNFRFALL